jgi:hypothetical protein
MKITLKHALLPTALALLLPFSSTVIAVLLPSWNDTSPKQAITAFVEKVTKEGSPDFVPVPERIATFDNDGTLWSEQPMYFQAFFIFDRIKALAPQHPDWKDKEPFASVLKGDTKAALAGGIEFMRPWTEKVYGIPPEQVVGSSATSDVVRFLPQETPMATCKCSNGPPPAPARAFAFTFIIPTPHVNGHTTVNHPSASSIKVLTKRTQNVGLSSI